MTAGLKLERAPRHIKTPLLQLKMFSVLMKPSLKLFGKNMQHYRALHIATWKHRLNAEVTWSIIIMSALLPRRSLKIYFYSIMSSASWNSAEFKKCSRIKCQGKSTTETLHCGTTSQDPIHMHIWSASIGSARSRSLVPKNKSNRLFSPRVHSMFPLALCLF